MALAGEAIRIARSLLNDDTAVNWPDHVLMEKLKTAHREMQAELQLNSIPVVKNQSAVILVNAGDLDLGVNQPANLIEPIELKERDVGGSADDFEDMLEVSFIPEIDQDSTLIYWAWLGEKIQFLGSTVDREVLLRYIGGITVPLTLNDSIGFLQGEIFLGPRIAYLASGNSQFLLDSQRNLDTVIRFNVKGKQGVVHRRLPYRYGGRRRLGFNA